MSAPTYRNGIRVEPDEGYNGWTNYPTWAVKLWIDNEESSYTYWREQADDVLNNRMPGDTDIDGPAYVLAEMLKDSHEEHGQGVEYGASMLEASVYSDLMGYALGCVNWHEIAETMIGDAISEAGQ